MARLGLRGRLALDANCLSYIVLGLEPFRERKVSRAIAEAAAWGIEVSAVALSEVLAEPARNGPRERFNDIAAAIENSQLISIVPTDSRIARLAAEVRSLRSCKLPDAIVIASAIATEADVLLSNDRQVVRVAAQYIRAVYFDDWEP